MSERNGDKARFQRERQKKLLRRERTLALSETLGVNSTELEAAKPAETGTKIASIATP